MASKSNSNQGSKASSNKPKSANGHTSVLASPGRLVTASSALSGHSILSERIVETEVKVPKRVMREDIVERTIVVPERVLREEIIEETHLLREKVVEIAKPVIRERVVEVEEIEYVEKIVEVPVTEYVEKIVHVPRVVYEERIVHVPKIVYQEKIVEVPEVEYRERIIEKTVEVPEYQDEVVIREVPVIQRVEKLIPEVVTVEVPQFIERNIPVPIEATTVYEFQLPQLAPKYTKKQLAIYAPRFVEVPIPAELMDEHLQRQAIQLQEQVHLLAAQKAPSLAEVEKIAEYVKNNDFQKHIHASNFQQAIASAWRSGSISINSHGSEHARAAARSAGPAPVVRATAHTAHPATQHPNHGPATSQVTHSASNSGHVTSPHTAHTGNHSTSKHSHGGSKKTKKVAAAH